MLLPNTKTKLNLLCLNLVTKLFSFFSLRKVYHSRLAPLFSSSPTAKAFEEVLSNHSVLSDLLYLFSSACTADPLSFPSEWKSSNLFTHNSHTSAIPTKRCRPKKNYSSLNMIFFPPCSCLPIRQLLEAKSQVGIPQVIY